MDLKTRLSELLPLYLTMLSLFEAIVLEQLVTRVALVSGGTFFEGWTVGLLLQALIILFSILHMWVGFMTTTAPIKRLIRGTDLLIPFFLGGVQLVAIQLMDLTIEPAFLAVYAAGMLGGIFAASVNLAAARKDNVSMLVAKLFPFKTYTLMTWIGVSAGVIGAATLFYSQMVGLIFAAIVLAIFGLMVAGSLHWWSRLVAMRRVSDPESDSPLRGRVTGLLSVYLTLVSMIEAVILEQLISRVAVVSGGPFLEGWTVSLGLQAATVFTSIITMWLAFLTDLIPLRRIMYSFDLVNVFGIGLFQLIAVQLIDTEIQVTFLIVFSVGCIGAVVTRYKNHQFALTDNVAKGLVMLYPHRQMLVLLGLMVPVAFLGALSMARFSYSGQAATFILFAILLSIDIMLIRWWGKVIKMRKLQL